MLTILSRKCSTCGGYLFIELDGDKFTVLNNTCFFKERVKHRGCAPTFNSVLCGIFSKDRYIICKLPKIVTYHSNGEPHSYTRPCHGYNKLGLFKEVKI